MKDCAACGAVLPADAFYRHPQMADGRMHICKECHKSRVHENRAAKKDYYLEFDRRRAFDEKRVAARKAYQELKKGDDEFRDRMLAARKKWRDRNAVKRRAHIMVGNALKYRGLKRQPCEECGATAEAHHEDYYKPLEVHWLCRTHHSLRHREINADMRRDPAKWARRGFTPENEAADMEDAA